MPLQDTDKFLVNRVKADRRTWTRNSITQSHYVEKQNLMAQLRDTDLMLVNRQVNGVQQSFKATGAEIKDSLAPSNPPIIETVSLSEQSPDTPERFTSQKFDVGVTTNNKGAEPMTYGLKAKVTGDLVKQIVTSEIRDVNRGGPQTILTFADDKDLAYLEPGDEIRQDNASSGTPPIPSGTVGSVGDLEQGDYTVTLATSNEGDGIIVYSDNVTVSGGQNKFDTPKYHAFDGSTSTALVAPGGKPENNSSALVTLNTTLTDVNSLRVCIRGDGGPNNWDTIIKGTGIDDTTISAADSSSFQTVNLNSTTVSGMNWQLLGDGGTATRMSAIEVNGSILVDGTGPKWSPNTGNYAIGPTKVVQDANLYCVFDTTGKLVPPYLDSLPQEWQEITTGMTVEETATLTFPALLASGNPPDTDLPEGTKLQAEVRCTNIAGEDMATTNGIEPKRAESGLATMPTSLFADNPEDVAKFNEIKDALEAYEGNAEQFRSDLFAKLAGPEFTEKEKAYIDEQVK